ncbi:FK506 binding protein proline rotamase rapamycin-binding protein [Clarireedia jacksonii]
MSYILQRLRVSAQFSKFSASFQPKPQYPSKFQYRNFSRTNFNMGVQKTILKEGNGEIPKAGDTVTIEYTGWLKDATKVGEEQKVKPPFDSSVDRGAFVVQIGVGQVIKGWDEGVTTMKVGEKALLDISPDYAYGAR